MQQKPATIIQDRCLIDGHWTGAPVLDVINPATGERVGRVPDLGAAETRAAIEAANTAFPAWSGMLAKERGAILRRWYELQREFKEELAQLMTAEQGKPLAEARAEVDYGSSFTELYAEEAKRILGEIIPTPKKSARMLVLRQPVGVVVDGSNRAAYFYPSSQPYVSIHPSRREKPDAVWQFRQAAEAAIRADCGALRRPKPGDG